MIERTKATGEGKGARGQIIMASVGRAGAAYNGRRQGADGERHCLEGRCLEGPQAQLATLYMGRWSKITE